MPVTKYGQSRNPKTSTGAPKKPETFICTRCGEVFGKVKRDKEFAMVKSPLWEKNGYRLPICSECLNFLYNFYFRALGDEKAAYRRVCMKFDMYYSDEIVESVLKNEASQERMKPYIQQLNFSRYVGKTYDDTIQEEHEQYLYGDFMFQYEDADGNIINARQELEKLKAQMESEHVKLGTDVDPELERFFGLGFTQKEFEFMKDAYDKELQNIPESCVQILDETIKDLCRFKILQGRAIEMRDTDEINKYSNLYQKNRKYIDDYVAKQKKNDNATSEQIAVTILASAVEQFCPTEIYKKKGIFADVDSIGEYIERFFLRPARNFFLGTRELDHKYNVDKEMDNDS